MTNTERVEAYLKHLGTKISTAHEDESSAEFVIYRQDTADGYEVFIAKYNNDKPLIIEDELHYYSHDLLSVFMERIKDCKSIYIDEDVYNDQYMEDDLVEEYNKWKANS